MENKLSGPEPFEASTFLAAKAQLNTCTCLVSVCLSVRPSVVKTEFLPAYTIVQLVTACDSFVMFRLCAFPLCPFVPFVPLYAPFTPSHVMFRLCAFPLCLFVPLYVPLCPFVPLYAPFCPFMSLYFPLYPFMPLYATLCPFIPLYASLYLFTSFYMLLHAL